MVLRLRTPHFNPLLAVMQHCDVSIILCCWCSFVLVLISNEGIMKPPALDVCLCRPLNKTHLHVDVIQFSSSVGQNDQQLQCLLRHLTCSTNAGSFWKQGELLKDFVRCFLTRLPIMHSVSFGIGVYHWWQCDVLTLSGDLSIVPCLSPRDLELANQKKTDGSLSLVIKNYFIVLSKRLWFGTKYTPSCQSPRTLKKNDELWLAKPCRVTKSDRGYYASNSVWNSCVKAAQPFLCTNMLTCAGAQHVVNIKECVKASLQWSPNQCHFEAWLKGQTPPGLPRHGSKVTQEDGRD